MTIYLTISLILLFLGIYFLVRNERVYRILKKINREIKFKIDMAQTKKDLKEIEMIFNILSVRKHYNRMLFSLKNLNICEYEIRKELGMLK